MITPKTKQYILIGGVNFPARTENQIREAIDKVFDINDDEDEVHNTMIKQELGL